jgi:hypothetical protein
LDCISDADPSARCNLWDCGIDTAEVERSFCLNLRDLRKLKRREEITLLL